MLDLIKRNTPRIADQFILKTIESDNGYDCYEIYAEDKKVVLAGNCVLSQAMAYYDYLNRFHGVVITSGDYDISTLSSAPLPEENSRQKFSGIPISVSVLKSTPSKPTG